jgi:hypothetical protein
MWPSNFPPNCPPEKAKKEQLTVYRIVGNNPPLECDFQTTKQEHPHRGFEEKDICNANAVSVFKNRTDVEKKKNHPRLAKKFAGKMIAQGTIDTHDGVTLKTYSDSHMSWWINTSMPHIKFEVI